ncbi:MAG TPA: cytochrome c maturation protein CcmE [Candidatus Cybelea sp.]|nr:cytochrome c maturation protein CcmE [Candidatus Cybelea sp.]
MTRKRRRLYVVIAAMTALGVATALVLFALRDNLTLFFSPSELADKHIPAGQRVRIGGLVEEKSLVRNGTTATFRITDMQRDIKVTYTGLLPDLFREGQGVVAQGRLDAGGVFVADEILAKHDERYMPPEVAAALKKSGHWQPESAQRGVGK